MYYKPFNKIIRSLLVDITLFEVAVVFLGITCL